MQFIIGTIMILFGIYMVMLTFMYPVAVIGVGIVTYVLIALTHNYNKRRNDAANARWAAGDRDA